MKFISYKSKFVCKITEIHILINEKSNREIPGFFKISRDISRPKIEPGSRELNPNTDRHIDTLFCIYSVGLTQNMTKKMLTHSDKITNICYHGIIRFAL